jgi:hypothetical protein
MSCDLQSVYDVCTKGAITDLIIPLVSCPLNEVHPVFSTDALAALHFVQSDLWPITCNLQLAAPTPMLVSIQKRAHLRPSHNVSFDTQTIHVSPSNSHRERTSARTHAGQPLEHRPSTHSSDDRDVATDSLSVRWLSQEHIVLLRSKCTRPACLSTARHAAHSWSLRATPVQLTVPVATFTAASPNGVVPGPC